MASSTNSTPARTAARTATPPPRRVDPAAARRAAQIERATRAGAWRAWQREARRSGRLGSLQQRLLPVKETLADGTVVIRGPGDQGPDTAPAPADQFVAVLEVGSVNFHLLSPEEQEALIDQYQRLLAAQPTPVHIKIRLRPIDLSSYLASIRAAAARPFPQVTSTRQAAPTALTPDDLHAPHNRQANAANAPGATPPPADPVASRVGVRAAHDTRDARDARGDSAAPWRVRLAEDHLGHLTTLAAQRNLLERRFYLILSATGFAAGGHGALASALAPVTAQAPLSRLHRALAAGAAWLPLPLRPSPQAQRAQWRTAPLRPMRTRASRANRADWPDVLPQPRETERVWDGAGGVVDDARTSDQDDDQDDEQGDPADDPADAVRAARGDPFGEIPLASPWARGARGYAGATADRAWGRRHAAQQHLDQRCRDLIRTLSTLRLSARRLDGDDLLQLLASCVSPAQAQRYPLAASHARTLIPWPTVVSRQPIAQTARTQTAQSVLSAAAGAPLNPVEERRLWDGHATPSPIGRGARGDLSAGDDGGDGTDMTDMTDMTGLWRPLADTLAPASAEVHPDWLRVGEELSATVAVTGYPRFVAPGWFGDLVDLDQPGLEIDLHLRPRANPAMIHQLRRRLTELDASRRIDQRAGRLEDPERRLAVADLTTMIDRLQRSEERIFEVGFYVTARAPRRNLRLLHARVRQIESALGAAFLSGGLATFEQAGAFRSLLPLGLDALHRFRLLDAATLASAFPFTSLSLTMPEGALYGVVPQNNSLVVLDPFSSQLENANMTIFAKSGAGKSYFCKLLALRMLLLGTAITIIDPEPLEEYRGLCEAAHGAYLRLAPNADARINPFDLPQDLPMGAPPPPPAPSTPSASPAPSGERATPTDGGRLAAHALVEKIQSLLTFLALLVAEAPPGETPYLTNEEKGALDQALHRTYARAGITDDPATYGRTPPLLRDLYDTLRGARTPIAPIAQPTSSGVASVGNERMPPTPPDTLSDTPDAEASASARAQRPLRQAPRQAPRHAHRQRGAPPRILPFSAADDDAVDTRADADGATPLDRRLADRLARYVHGSLASLFAGQTTVRLDNPFVVFSLRDLDGDLRPVGLWLVSEFVWTRMRQEKGRQPRLLFIDEAWTLAQRPEGGQFLAGLARRARKYYLGLVTSTQDVGDFLQNTDGRTVLNQASIQLLLMQSSATIQQVVETFRLTQGERNYLLACPKGHGLLFARNTHVALRIEASPFEHQLATTNPRERAALEVLQEQGQERLQGVETLGSAGARVSASGVSTLGTSIRHPDLSPRPYPRPASASPTEPEEPEEPDTYADHQGGAG